MKTQSLLDPELEAIIAKHKGPSPLSIAPAPSPPAPAASPVDVPTGKTPINTITLPEPEAPKFEGLDPELADIIAGAKAQTSPGYGNRPDGTPKGKGFFGEMQLPNGAGAATEYSIGVNIDGKEMEIPSLVPTLTPDEQELMRTQIIPRGEKPPPEIAQKAIDHARQRISAGKNVFADEGEQLDPELALLASMQRNPLDPSGLGDEDRPTKDWIDEQKDSQNPIMNLAGGVAGFVDRYISNIPYAMKQIPAAFMASRFRGLQSMGKYGEDPDFSDMSLALGLMTGQMYAKSPLRWTLDKLAPNFGDYAEKRADEYQRIFEDIGEEREQKLGQPSGLAERVADIAGSSEGMNIPGMALTFVNPPLGLAAMYFNSKDNQESERIAAKDSILEAQRSGAVEGLAETVPELWPIGKALTSSAPFAKKLAQFIIREIPSEMTSEAVEALRDKIYHNPGMTTGEFLKDLLEREMLVALSVPVSGGAHFAAGTAAKKGKQVTEEYIKKGRKLVDEYRARRPGAYSPLGKIATRNEGLAAAQAYEQAIQEELDKTLSILEQEASLGMPPQPPSPDMSLVPIGPAPEDHPIIKAAMDRTIVFEGQDVRLGDVAGQLKEGEVYNETGHIEKEFEDQITANEVYIKELESAPSSALTSEFLDRMKKQTRELRQRLRSIREVRAEVPGMIKEMLKGTGVTEPVVVNFHDGTAPDAFQGQRIYGLTYGTQKIHFVHLDMQTVLNKLKNHPGALPRNAKAAFAETLSHELGHTVMRKFWEDKRFDKARIALVRAYARFGENLIKSGKNMAVDLFQAFDQPALTAFEAYGHHLAGGPKDTFPITEKGLRPSNVTDANKFGYYSAIQPRFFDFQEFAANQIGRSLAKKYAGKSMPELRPMAKALHKVWRKARSRWGTDETFSTFLRALSQMDQLVQAQKLVAEQQRLKNEAVADMIANPPHVKVARRMGRMFASIEKIANKEDVGDDFISYKKSGGAATTTGGNLSKAIDKYNWFIRWTAGLLQLRDMNPNVPGFTALVAGIKETYVQASERFWQIRAMWTERAIEITREWINFMRDEGHMDAFDNLLFEADAMSDANDRALNPVEEAQLAAKHGLDQADLDMARKIWNIFREAITAVEQIRIREIQSLVASISNPNGISQQEANKRILVEQDKFQKMRNRNYMPHMRFGKYTVTIRALAPVTFQGKQFKAGQLVTYMHFENKRHRNKAEKTLEGQFPPNSVIVQQGEVPDAMMMYQGFNPGLVRELLDKANLSAADRAAIDEELVRLSPAASFSRQLLRRKNILGYSQHSTRVFSNYFQRFANHIARIETRPAAEAAMSAMDDSIKLLRYQGKRQQLLAWVKRHHHYLMNPTNELANLRAVGAILYLGFVAKSAIVNFTQVPLILFPHLSKKYGTVTAVKMIMGALTDVIREYTKGNVFTANEAAGMAELVRMGKTDQSLATELAALGEGSFFQRGTSWFWETTDKTALKMFKAQEYAMLMFQAVEKLNRRITGLSVIRQELANGRPLQEAVDEAAKTIDRTMFEYARYDRPELMRGKQSILFLFQTYMVKMGYFIYNDPGRWRYLMMLLLMGGYTALPGLENVSDLIEFALRKFKEKAGLKNPWVDLHTDARNLMEHIHNRTNGWWPEADLAEHGLSAYLGPFDISGSLSFGRILPFTQHLNNPNMKPMEALQASVVDQSGALIALPMNIVTAFGSDDPSVWKRIEMGLPGELKNASRATRWATWGYETDSSGAKIASFDSVRGRIEIAGQAVGFAPSRIREMKNEQWNGRRAVEYYMGRKGIILKAFNNAAMSGNQEDITEALEGIYRYNKTVPRPELRITSKDRKASTSGATRSRHSKEQGIHPNKRYHGLYEEVITDSSQSHQLDEPSYDASDTQGQ